ncbi:hypothetical protein [Streptomyces sp. NPDC047000]|uniref:hypothetical protein n=1 Tax=Streptomyces sp. NPDC047000 TaxID=3155474 RepID=UPI0033E48F4A
MFSEPALLRIFAATAAATALVGAAVMRRWDSQAGKQVADISRARVSDEWRHEEKAAELETDLDEARELRAKLEQRLRAKRAELAALRNEHAALLRRYATAETERATALEGRRLLEIEATVPDSEEDDEAEAPLDRAGAVAAPAESGPAAPKTETDEAEGGDGAGDGELTTVAVFSAEGSRLFLRAAVALSRLDGQDDRDEQGVGDDGAGNSEVPDGTVEADTAPDASDEEPSAGEPAEDSSQESGTGPDAGQATERDTEPADELIDEPADGGEPEAAAVRDAATEAGPETGAQPDASSGTEAEADGGSDAGSDAGAASGARQAVADEHRHAAAPGTSAAFATAPALPSLLPAQSALPVRQPSGHFTVPTAVAVVPAAPVRRPTVEGGFDFFGTQKEAAAQSPAMESAQNAHPAPGGGRDALAVHKPESEASYKPAQEGTRAVGQVIDLTAHDETEHIDLQGLRTAAS